MPITKPKGPLRNDQRWCQWCADIVSFRRFDKHVKACERNQTLLHQPKKNQKKSSLNQYNGHRLSTPVVDNQSLIGSTASTLDNEIEMSDTQMEFESEEEDLSTILPAFSSTQPVCAESGSFLRIVHHPHSAQGSSTIISLDNPLENGVGGDPDGSAYFQIHGNPWAPFRTRTDFEFAEFCVTETLSQRAIKQLLEGHSSTWVDRSNLSIKRLTDYQESMAAARKFTVEFQDGETFHTFQGQEYHFKFRYRDPWKWLLNIITDPALAHSIMWYPVEKWLHHRGRITRIYDELNSGTRWWEVQNTLPQGTRFPHVYLPLHIWLDKSKVAKTVTKHPIILRPGFLPSTIRNGSGNGGGVLIGYMVIIGNPDETVEDETLDSVEHAQFKREVYHEILRHILRTLAMKSHNGYAVTCGDNITRVVHPGFMIHAVDGEEACSICGTRGPKANYPCPSCLVHREELNLLTKTFEPRTQESMMELYHKCKTLSKTSRETLLRNHGLHFVKNAFWDIAHSDPYRGISYDILHAFDLGEWGKHQWPLIRNYLTVQQKNDLNKNMWQVPRWSGLKHFSAVASIEFSDGNGYREILKCILPCIVGILPRNSPIVQSLRLLAIFRMIASLNPISEEHLQYLQQQVFPKYEKICSHLSQNFDKNYNYPKHHIGIHIPDDCRAKGALDHMSTRMGEGFQQEVQQAYDQTNFKDTEIQMTRIDENQEAIARIRLTVDNYDKQMAQAKEEQKQTDQNDFMDPAGLEKHWSLGSPLPAILAQKYEADCIASGQTGFRFFYKKLRLFLSQYIAVEEQPEEPLKITPFQCLYLRYRSLEDWREKKDILRCNPDFHGQPRYDFVLINTNPPSYGRILAMFSCNGHHDIALLQTLQPSSWKPKTNWDGCQVFEEKEADFFLIKYFICGCHFIPAFNGPSKTHYLNDTVDADAFLRFFLEERLTQCDM